MNTQSKTPTPVSIDKTFPIGSKVKDLSGCEGTVIENPSHNYLIRVSFSKYDRRDLNPEQLTPLSIDKEVLEITKGEWYISESIQHDENMCAVPYYEIANKNSSFWIAQINASDRAFGKTAAEANAKAICTAINSTYGKGYNPAAMEELYKALEGIMDWQDKHPEISFIPSHILLAAETSLNNAKL